ncbi:conserved hypothetical protein [Anaeromyxobacter sp. K]|uniref:hypothetical protein n=1 Tax=Anaeromyxobacter sp. (strain K) TaxID=447217 RepID=UPI00015F9E7A|nr:hypothetical protein [Anaeromyxobacter sp. K]ACG74534.1 conserved hypothetical protein [Anaeromyxobacter sp. K]
MAITVPTRPFASDLITGLMLPDGIFVTMLGKQNINLQVQNAGGGSVAAPKVYIESVSHPAIAYSPGTRFLPTLPAKAVHVEQWLADFSQCPSGVHHISFIVEDAAGTKSRFIKKIFVMGVAFDPTTHTFHAETPQGVLSVNFLDLVRPARGCKNTQPAPDGCCGHKRREDPRSADELAHDTSDRRLRGLNRAKLATGNLTALFERLGPSFEFCPPGYLPHVVEMAWTPTPPYAGQYSDLPFEDPWWKIVLCILAVLLLIAAAIAESVDGSGDVVVGGGSGDTGSPVGDCCGVRAGGGGTSPIAAGLVAAAAAAATAAAMSDARDPIRRGQDATLPGAGELTMKELLRVELTYPEAVALGRPFAARARWDYKRATNAAIYEASGNDLNHNLHVTSSYEIDAPEVVASYAKDGEWVIKARFRDQDGNLFRGAQLLVQCFLVGPQGQSAKLLLQDDGSLPDEKPGDGTYAGRRHFSQASAGLWRYFVIAQDVNHATPDLKPEDAAQIIGGMVVTHQLTITFDEDDCPFVPDGHVMVV